MKSELEAKYIWYPPMSSIKDKALANQVDLLTHLRRVRQGVAMIRHTWGIPPDGLPVHPTFEEGKTPKDELWMDTEYYEGEEKWRYISYRTFYRENHAKLDEFRRHVGLLHSYAQPLSDAWKPFFMYIVLFNDISHVPDRQLMAGQIGSPIPDDGKIEVISSSSGPEPTLIRVNTYVTKADWTRFYDNVLTKFVNMPRKQLKGQQSDIALLSRLSDLSQEYASLKHTPDYAMKITLRLEDEGFDPLTPAEIHDKLREARKLGL